MLPSVELSKWLESNQLEIDVFDYLKINSNNAINEHAQTIIDIFYKKAMPKKMNSCYDDYDSDIKEEENPEVTDKGIKRLFHGGQHVSRAAIYIKILANLYKYYGTDPELTDEEVKLLQIAALFHDAGREAEESDEWELESAELCFYYLTKTLHVKIDVAIEFAEAIANKDAFETQELTGGAGRYKVYHELRVNDNGQLQWQEEKPSEKQNNYYIKLLHDADCLDILRARDGFEGGRLHFYSEVAKENQQAFEDLAMLICDVRQVISEQGDARRNQDIKIKEQYELADNCYEVTLNQIKEKHSILSCLYTGVTVTAQPKSLYEMPKYNPELGLTAENLTVAVFAGQVYSRGIEMPSRVVKKELADYLYFNLVRSYGNFAQELSMAFALPDKRISIMGRFMLPDKSEIKKCNIFIDRVEEKVLILDAHDKKKLQEDLGKQEQEFKIADYAIEIFDEKYSEDDHKATYDVLENIVVMKHNGRCMELERAVPGNLKQLAPYFYDLKNVADEKIKSRSDDESSIQLELRKTKREKGNPARSISMIGPGMFLFAPAGFLIIDKNKVAINGVNLVDADSGRGKKTAVRQVKCSKSDCLNRLLLVNLLGGKTHRDYGVATNEITADIRDFDAIYFTDDPTFANSFKNSRNHKPTHKYSPIIQAIYIHHFARELPLFHYSSVNHSFTKYEIPDNNGIYEMWKAIINDNWTQRFDDQVITLLHDYGEIHGEDRFCTDFDDLIAVVKSCLIYGGNLYDYLGSERKCIAPDSIYDDDLEASITQLIREKIYAITKIEINGRYSERDLFLDALPSMDKVKSLEVQSSFIKAGQLVKVLNKVNTGSIEEINLNLREYKDNVNLILTLLLSIIKSKPNIKLSLGINPPRIANKPLDFYGIYSKKKRRPDSAESVELFIEEFVKGLAEDSNIESIGNIKFFNTDLGNLEKGMQNLFEKHRVQGPVLKSL